MGSGRREESVGGGGGVGMWRWRCWRREREGEKERGRGGGGKEVGWGEVSSWMHLGELCTVPHRQRTTTMWICVLIWVSIWILHDHSILKRGSASRRHH